LPLSPDLQGVLAFDEVFGELFLLADGSFDGALRRGFSSPSIRVRLALEQAMVTFFSADAVSCAPRCPRPRNARSASSRRGPFPARYSKVLAGLGKAGVGRASLSLSAPTSSSEIQAIFWSASGRSRRPQAIRDLASSLSVKLSRPALRRLRCLLLDYAQSVDGHEFLARSVSSRATMTVPASSARNLASALPARRFLARPLLKNLLFVLAICSTLNKRSRCLPRKDLLLAQALSIELAERLLCPNSLSIEPWF